MEEQKPPVRMTEQTVAGRGIVQTGGGAVVKREEFGATQSVETGELQAQALAARERAMIESRYVMARKFPRVWDDVRVKILAECKRPDFAASAIYELPFGDKVSGFSIRFAESCARIMGNVRYSSALIYDDPEKQIVRVEVEDLESNTSFAPLVTIPKLVERKKLREGQRAAGTRRNSVGEMVHLVEPAENELLGKINAYVARALRNEILRLVPGDLKSEAWEAIERTTLDKAAQDPGAEKKKLADGFAELGVLPSQVAELVGVPLDRLEPADLVKLRKIYAAVRDGHVTVRELLEQVRSAAGDKAEEQAAGRSGEPPTKPAEQAKGPAPASEPIGKPAPASAEESGRGTDSAAKPEPSTGQGAPATATAEATRSEPVGTPAAAEGPQTPKPGGFSVLLKSMAAYDTAAGASGKAYEVMVSKYGHRSLGRLTGPEVEEFDAILRAGPK